MGSRTTAEADARFMDQAIALGVSALGFASPNPAVGCVIVKGGRIVGKGKTAPGGRPHAETQAIAAAGNLARGATVYVSLEPCAHHGQTPPCAEALVEAGVRRVVIGCIDPYPKVRGGGIAILKRGGIKVTLGVRQAEAIRANEGFFTRVAKGRPRVLLKLAMTLDGRIATATGDSKWISSEQSRELVHQWRRQSDAVIVGAGTVVADNPRLTCRTPGGRDPVRVIIDSNSRTPPRAKVFTQRSLAPTVLVTSRAKLALAHRRYTTKNLEILSSIVTRQGVALSPLMDEFGRRGWNNVMIEGGAHLAAGAVREGIVDRIAFFVAPRILGGGLPVIEGLRFARLKDSIGLKDFEIRRIGPDLLIEARPVAGYFASG